MQRWTTEEPDVWYFPQFLTKKQADEFFHWCCQQQFWAQEELTMFGKTVKEPRLTAFVGDSGIQYTYSQKEMKALLWMPKLLQIKQQVEAVAQASFTCVLLNWYRDGQDYMGWHSDDEVELGPEPVIASLSLGAERSFQFRKKKDKQYKKNFELQHGSLLVMKGNTQQVWQHQLPKRRRIAAGRINLTFRRIVPFF